MNDDDEDTEFDLLDFIEQQLIDELDFDGDYIEFDHIFIEPGLDPDPDAPWVDPSEL